MSKEQNRIPLALRAGDTLDNNGEFVAIGKDGAITPGDGVQFLGASYARECYASKDRHYDLGHKWRTYDDGYGPLWIMHQGCGNGSTPAGIVRAATWEDAYQIFCDEILADGEEPEEWMFDEERKADHANQIKEDREVSDIIADLTHEEECWEEANGWRGGTPTDQDDNHKTAIYEKCLSTGNPMSALTIKDAKDHGLMLKFKTYEDGPDGPNVLTLILHR